MLLRNMIITKSLIAKIENRYYFNLCYYVLFATHYTYFAFINWNKIKRVYERIFLLLKREFLNFFVGEYFHNHKFG